MLLAFNKPQQAISTVGNGSHEFLPIVVGAKFGRLTKEQSRILSQFIQAVSQIDGPEQ